MTEHLVSGLWVVLATPFDADLELDVASLRRQVAAARGAGADGLVALGVFGEAASLSLSEQRAVAACVAAEADGLPIVLGVPGRTTAVAVEQARNALAGAAEGAGQVAERRAAPGTVHLMLQANAADPATVVEHLRAVHRATGAPVVLQDYPAASGIRVSAATLAEVIEACEFVVAVKAEAPPTAVAIAELAHLDVPVFGGLGGVGLVDELDAGAAGAMTGFSHPEGLRETLDAFTHGGFAAGRAAWAPWLPLAGFEAQVGIALAIRKMLLHRRGVLDHPAVRPPAPRMPPLLLPLLERHLAAVHVPATVAETEGGA